MFSDERFKNLYDTLISHANYGNYMLSVGEAKMDISDTNYDALSASFISAFIEIGLDPFIVKTKDKEVKINIIDEFIDELAKKISVNNGNGYTIGELSYKNSTVLIDKVRNKLAHGDYIIKDGNIIFEENNLKGIIKINSLLEMVKIFKDCHKYYKANGKIKQVINSSYGLEKLGKIVDKKTLDKACDNIKLIEIVDYPKIMRKRNKNYREVVESFYNIVKELLEKNPNITEENLKIVVEVLKPQLDNYGIEIEIKIKKLSESENIEYIKENYMDNLDILNRIDKYTQGRYLTNLEHRFKEGEYQKINLLDGIYYNLEIIKIMKNDKPKSFKELVKIINKKGLFTYNATLDLNNTMIATKLVGFNSYFQYGLEKGLTKKGCYDLKQLTLGKSLDFSALQLDTLDDPNMLIEHKFECYDTDIERFSKDLEKTKLIADKKYDKLFYYKMKKGKDADIEVIKKLRNIFIESDNKQIREEVILDFIKKFNKDFDKEKYVRNINIIEHIRNAIAHGNIFVNVFDGQRNLDNTTIIIRDYLDKELVYEKKLTIEQFSDLFVMRNFYAVYNFICNNIENKDLIDDTYLDRLNILIEDRNVKLK